MKVTYIERLESRTAFSRDMFCPKCGSHGYVVVEQLQPENPTPWWVRCEECDFEGNMAPTRHIAIEAWRRI